MPRASWRGFLRLSFAPFFSVLPDLFVAGDDTREIPSLAPGVATSARSMWPRTLCPVPMEVRFALFPFARSLTPSLSRDFGRWGLGTSA
jgi:hypothetical protein